MGHPIVCIPAGMYARLRCFNNRIIDSGTFWTGFLILLMRFIIFGLLTLIGG